MIKKIALIVIGVLLLAGIGTFFYLYHFQNMPEFSLSLLTEIPKAQRGEKILIFSPHNDDEVLGAGGYIHDCVAAGANVTVVFLTNGDGHHYSSSEEFHRLYPTPDEYIQSGYTRQNESKNALKTLGINDNNIIFLGYPDGGLDQLLNKNWDSVYESKYTKHTTSPYNNSYTKDVSYTGANVNNDIVKILNQINPDIILVTNPKDTNQDHAATSQFVTNVLTTYDKSSGKKPVLYYYLIHYWHFPYPKGYHEGDYLMPPMRLLFQNWQKYSLSDTTENTKKQALTEYSSQLKVPMLKGLMEGFVKKNELFVKD